MRTDEEITEYVLRHYIGWGNLVVKGRTRHMRLFQWRDRSGEWVGNRRAFYLHLARTFGFKPTKMGHDTMNKALVACNERVYPQYERTGDTRSTRFVPPAGPIKRRLAATRRR